ncbi:hypothetical protein QA648_22335 (plasmid) [Rhizobium sp. CB3171]|uniref:hypothetical protein n=1 Tax=unclassified Rhizobium TaxID=2613769 RepID=UPI000CF21258|nr:MULTISPECIES: hypothetical protein [unclassified Rhizobium]MDK4741350.1 hypothetical protein [Rhizobium sp. CNPSo 3464]WFU05898.1 hypothetical protein QA648_22335 [Rhizobium sp. CB3171]
MLNYMLRSPMTVWSMAAPAVVFLAGAILGALMGPLPPFVMTVEFALLALTMALSALAALLSVAPPSITRREVRWANENAAILYTIPVTFEEVDFIPPLLSRVAAYRDDDGTRRRVPSYELRALRA